MRFDIPTEDHLTLLDAFADSKSQLRWWAWAIQPTTQLRLDVGVERTLEAALGLLEVWQVLHLAKQMPLSSVPCSVLSVSPSPEC